MKRIKQRSETLLRVACVLTLVSLTLIGWAVLHPRPMPVIVAMSVGQGLGTLAVLLFAIVVLRDLRPVMRAPVPEAAPSQSQRPPPVTKKAPASDPPPAKPTTPAKPSKSDDPAKP